jgi:hypothetical protein
MGDGGSAIVAIVEQRCGSDHTVVPNDLAARRLLNDPAKRVR